MAVSLESLEMGPEELDIARDAIRRLAYQKWELAGKPDSDGSLFWVEAEREWIERWYVPPRRPELTVVAEPRAREPQPHREVERIAALA